MATYLVPSRSQGSFGIAICDRCGRKFFEGDLHSDPNAPGLMVCRADLDVLDPYRIPARKTETAALHVIRPDVPLDNSSQVFMTETTDDFVVTENSGGDDVFIRRGIRAE